MNGTDVLLSAMAKAKQPGPLEAPDPLIALIEDQADPLVAISDWEVCNKLFEAIRSQFAFIDLLRVGGKPPSDTDLDKFIGLLRWLIRESTDWSAGADPRRVRLVALFVIGQFATMEVSFWGTVPNEFRPNDDLLAALERVISGLTMSFLTRGVAAPIWELEAVEQFEKADAESDWIGIAQGWRLIEDGFSPSIAIVQAAQCLDRFAPERLVQAVSSLRQTAPVMSVVLSLTPNASLRLGSRSTNPHVQFATTYMSVSQRTSRATLSDDSKEHLVQLLKNILEDAPRWAAWMRVFNIFPSRFPELQTPLGCVLANANDTALQAYVDAINLHWSGQQGRYSVADCLRAFRRNAEVERRKALWGFAYERWMSWRFGLNAAADSLSRIARCELDYALVGYAVECLSDAQRQDMIGSLITTLQKLENNWYPGITDCLSEWNVVLSEMQPIFLAMSIVGTEDDWIDKGATMRLPFDPAKEAYVTLKFGKPQIS
ncbi:hypothetical protein RYH74_04465 [Pseudomonas sp. LSJ-87]|uniref:hypothetical protein n=1 Tax=Pseudomonas sp. LSJ-87 TaxID=3079932 RepID=UPI002941AC2E|nr:hypothetical protein [Pseudomonas sp. LSJ-87]MDV5096540.1 hypothetical protein [Pseudomonas sp. LSJ-87]